MPNYDKFNRVYFEEGVAHQVSGYTNYCWTPEFTIPLAHRIIKMLGLLPGQLVLDYGCAKGFLVKALNLLDIHALGCDVSGYALGMSPPDTRQYLMHSDSAEIPFQASFAWVIAKDTLEHLNEEELDVFLESAYEHSNKLFVVVPLGDGKTYNIPYYEHDVTHVLKKPMEWWQQKFEEHNWVVNRSTTDMKGLKDSWAHFPKGNAAFWCGKKEV